MSHFYDAEWREILDRTRLPYRLDRDHHLGLRGVLLGEDPTTWIEFGLVHGFEREIPTLHVLPEDVVNWEDDHPLVFAGFRYLTVEVNGEPFMFSAGVQVMPVTNHPDDLVMAIRLLASELWGQPAIYRT